MLSGQPLSFQRGQVFSDVFYGVLQATPEVLFSFDDDHLRSKDLNTLCY